MKSRLRSLRRISPELFAVIGLGALLLLVGSFFVDVRIVVERPHLGDVSHLVGIAWQTTLAGATLGSFLLAYRNYAAETRSSDGTPLDFEIRGQDHDIDVHLHIASLFDTDDDSDRAHERKGGDEEMNRGYDSARDTERDSERDSADEST